MSCDPPISEGAFRCPSHGPKTPTQSRRRPTWQRRVRKATQPQCPAIGSSRRAPLQLLIGPPISFRRPHDALDDLCAAVTHHPRPAVVDATFQLAAAAVLLEEGDEGISWSRTFALAIPPSRAQHGAETIPLQSPVQSQTRLAWALSGPLNRRNAAATRNVLRALISPPSLLTDS